MKKFKFLIIALFICLCCIVPFAGCGEDDSNPYYNGQSVIQSYELKEDDDKNPILSVVYNSELVNEEDRFRAVAVEKVSFERDNHKSINAVLRCKNYTEFAKRRARDGTEHYFVMDYLRPNEAFHASTDRDGFIAHLQISNIMYILIYPASARTVQDPNTDLLKYVGIIDLTSENA